MYDGRIAWSSSTDNFSLTRIVCHRNFGNEFAFTHSKGYLIYYLARSPLSRIFDIELNFHEHIFSAANLLCQRNIVRGNEAYINAHALITKSSLKKKNVITS